MREKSAQFVHGYPRSQAEKSEARAAIQANASRHRWHKHGSCATNSSSRNCETLRSLVKHRKPGAQPDNNDSGWPEPFSDARHVIASARPNNQQSRFWRTINARSLMISGSALNYVTISPTLPLGHLECLTTKDSWYMLRKVQDVLRNAFGEEPDSPNQFTAIWMRCIVSASETLYATIFSQAIRDANLDCSNTSRSRRIAVIYHHKSIVAINANMTGLDTACSDNTMLAVFIMAHHQLVDSTHHDTGHGFRPRQGPLNHLRLLSLYGGKIKSVPIHAEGYAKLVALRGGPSTLSLPGLVQQMSYSEIIQASQGLRPPSADFSPCIYTNFDASLSACRRPNHPLIKLGQGFDILTYGRVSNACRRIQLVLRRLALYSLGVDDYITGRSAKQSLAVIGEQRNFVQQDLMSLWSLSSRDQHTISRSSLIAGTIYSFLCVFPMPSAPFSELVHEMQMCFPVAELYSQTKTVLRLMMWALFMTGIASTVSPEQTWYIEILNYCLERLNITYWDDLKDALQQFLWFPVTNDEDGMKLWRRLQLSRAMVET